MIWIYLTITLLLLLDLLFGKGNMCDITPEYALMMVVFALLWPIVITVMVLLIAVAGFWLLIENIKEKLKNEAYYVAGHMTNVDSKKEKAAENPPLDKTQTT